MKKSIALITGSSRGIGKAIAKELCSEGYITVINGTNPETVEETVNELNGKGGQAVGLAKDLLTPNAAPRIINWIIDQFGGIDVLVNNAGIARITPFEEADEQDFDETMGLNVKLPMFLTQAALPYLLESREKAIVNISSMVAHKTYENRVLYTTSKYALTGMMKALSKDYISQGLRIYNISPGSVDTDMLRRECPDMDPGKLIQPEDLARTVKFLLSLTGNAQIDEIILRCKSNPPI